MSEQLYRRVVGAKQKILDCAAELNLSITSEFVPWSKSRSKDEEFSSLNWIVTLQKSGEKIWEGDYSSGVAHCPSYPGYLFKLTENQKTAIDWECENGREMVNTYSKVGGRKLEPDLADVLYSLASDMAAIDYRSFEDWANEFGYDTDSRKAEKTYQACLKIALALRNSVGEEGLKKLQEACRNY